MRSLLALIRKDLKSYFDQPTGYILLVVFVMALSWSFFRSVFLTDEASLRALFTVDFTVERPSLPWLLFLFVPAATMRLIAEEQRDGTLEILLTQPIRGWMILFAKFLSGLIFVGMAILATLGIPIALIIAGASLDIGAVVAQYVGSIFLAASFVSIGLFTSSLTRNQIVAFILGLTLIAILMLIGMEQVAVTLPDSLSALLQTLSPVTHFASMARGVIDLRDILYFIALISTFLSASYLIIRSKCLSHQSPQYRNLQLGVAGLIVLSLLVGWFGNSIKGRLDLTEDKLFSISPATVSILSDLDDIITLELFESNEPPPDIELVARDVNDFLNDLGNIDSKIKLSNRFPDNDDEIAFKAQLAGIFPRQATLAGQTEYQSKIVYLGLSLTYLNHREIIPFIESMSGFEYRIANLMHKMTKQTRKTIAFLTGHGERSIATELNTLSALLEQQYNVTEISPAIDLSLDLTDVDVLIIPGPTTEVADTTRDDLYDFLDNGGRALILVDPVGMDPRAGLNATTNLNDFSDFVEPYGVKIEEDLVFDTEFSATLVFPTNIGNRRVQYPYYPHIDVVDEKVSGNINGVTLAWASSMGISEPEYPNIEISKLLETSEFAAIDFNPGSLTPDAPVFQELSDENRVKSLTGVTVTGPSSIQDANQTKSDYFRLVVISDSDWLTENVVNGTEANLALGLNLVDWLAQEDILAEIRSKVASSRRLDFPSLTRKNIVQYVNILGVPSAIILLGLLRYARRRTASLMEYKNEN